MRITVTKQDLKRLEAKLSKDIDGAHKLSAIAWGFCFLGLVTLAMAFDTCNRGYTSDIAALERSVNNLREWQDKHYNQIVKIGDHIYALDEALAKECNFTYKTED